MKKFCSILIMATLVSGFAVAGEKNQADTVYADHNDYRIVGGVESEVNAWPWMTALVHANLSTDTGRFCSGSLIHPRWVLTAAHCLEEFDEDMAHDGYIAPDEIHAVVGIHNLSTNSGERIKVKRIVPHPDFAEKRVPDIALIELEAPSSKMAIPVYSGTSSLEGIMGTVIGWGAASNALNQVDVPIVSNTECSETMSQTAGYYYEITRLEMCAGYKQGGKDSCDGDSGGPLMVQSSQSSWLLAGVVSWGEGCAEPGYYGVYTRISAVIGFINQYVTPKVSDLFHSENDDYNNCFISILPGKN